MKLLVFSDTHRHTERMMEVMQQEKTADAIFFLGDGDSDADVLQHKYKHIPLYRVRGNCDYVSQDPLEGLAPFGGFLFLYTHGHQYHVKNSRDLLLQAAARNGADVALFGHTHTPYCKKHGDLWLFNPGSLTSPRGSAPSYGCIAVADGTIDFEIKNYPFENK